MSDRTVKRYLVWFLVVTSSLLSSCMLMMIPMMDMHSEMMDQENMKSMGDMNDMNMDKKVSAVSHKAMGVVKTIDVAKGTVTLAHEPVNSLNWPAMTMEFMVKDKALLDKLAPEKKVEFEFTEDGKGYVITAVK